MRATEIIRDILNLIDQVEDAGEEVTGQEPAVAVQVTKVSPEDSVMPLDNDVEAINRYKQIIDLLPDEQDELSPFTNTPNPKVADISAVTTQSGDDVNKSKHPADMRTNAPSLYPGAQWRGE
jgi:hypothetical protein